MEPLSSIRVSDPNRAMYYNKMNGLYYCRSAGRMWVYSGWVASAFEGDPLPEEFINLALTSPRVSGLSPDLVIVDDEVKDKPDEVNQPSHYKRESSDVLRAVRTAVLEDGKVDDLECIEAMVSMFPTVDQIRGYLRGNSFKYRWRYEDKDPIKSLRKAEWYEKKLERLEQIAEEHNG